MINNYNLTLTDDGIIMKDGSLFLTNVNVDIKINGDLEISYYDNSGCYINNRFSPNKFNYIKNKKNNIPESILSKEEDWYLFW